jgi:hypothetical protein
MSDDEQTHSGSSIQTLPLTLIWTNYIEFKRILYSYVVRYGPFVVATVQDFTDFGPPQHPGAGAQPHQISDYNREEKAYDKYKRDCAYVCSLLYNSLSTDIRIRVDGNPQAYRATRFTVAVCVRVSSRNGPEFYHAHVYKDYWS